jgi:putative MATE family efflux protein
MSGAIVISLGAILLPGTLMRIFTPEADIITEGIKYLRIIGFCYLATAITFSYSFIMRATHYVKLPVLISVFSIGVNTFLNWVLIYGHLGFDAMGVSGAAIATVIARTGEMLLLITVVYSKHLPMAARFNELFHWPKAFVKKYLKTVSPVIANELLWATGVTGYSLIYGRMGKVVMASMTISQTIEQLAFIIFFGMSSAAAVMLGNSLGASEMEKARVYAKRFIRLFFIIGIITSIVLYFVSSSIADIYQVDPEVKETVKMTLKIFSIFVTVKSLNLLIIVGILRSGGDTIAALLIDLISVWGFGLPLGIIGGLVLKLDIKYVYIMILSEEMFKVIINLMRYRSKKWIKNLVTEE